MVSKLTRRLIWTPVLLALALLLAAALWMCRPRPSIPPPHAYYYAQIPPSMVEEVERIVRRAAEERGLHLHAKRKGTHSSIDGLEYLSLWVTPSEEDKRSWLMVVARDVTRLTVLALEHDAYMHEEGAWTIEELDSLVGEVRHGLEGDLGLSLCDVDLDRGICVRPDAPRLLYRMDFDDRLAIRRYTGTDIARRHGVHALESSGERLEAATGVAGAVEIRFYPPGRAFNRGEFPLLLASGEAGRSLFLSAFGLGGMPADRLDALVRDFKTTLESRHGRSFCRANPATRRCDAEHAEREGQREAWLRARDAGANSIEAFLAAHPDNRHADAARRRLARLRAMAREPPRAPPAPRAPWLGRNAGQVFSDLLADGSRGPEMTVAPAGLLRMGCAAAVGCRLEELPVHEVRFARPFALSTREVTHAEYYRVARPEKRLDPSWSDRPAVHLTWDEAASYAAWLSEKTGADYRLPSEAEWEHAARAGTATAYPWGDAMERGRARCDDCPGQRPDGFNVFGYSIGPFWVSAVGSYPANAWGFHDMHGNAAEWTADCWHPDHLGAPPDGAARLDGDCSLRVVRGGSFDTVSPALRSAARAAKRADDRYLGVGFRVLRELRNAQPGE